MTAKNKKEAPKANKGKPEKAKPRAFTADIMPIVALDGETGAALLENRMLMDVMRVTTKDYNYISEDEKSADSAQFDRLFRTYPDDLKIISLYFPVNVERQISYFTRKMGNEENPKYRELIGTEIDKLHWIHKNRKEKQYFLVFYCEQDKYKDMLTSVVTSLSRSATPLVAYIKRETKIEIFRLLCNKNAAV
jgi:hypothetical protein